MIGQSSAAELQVPEPAFEAAPLRPAQSYWRESWERLLSNRIGMMCGVLVALLALVALAAPLIAHFVTHYDPAHQDLDNIFSAPDRTHWLGSDELGRDTLSRLVYGARVSLGVGFLTVAIALTVGATVGLIAGFYGRLIDDLLMRFVDILLSIPGIYLLILMASLFRPNAVTISFIIASIGWGGLARLIRGQVLSVKNQDFILATRSIGAGDLRLMLRHLLPNVLPIMIVAASLDIGRIILVEAALDFIGLGVHPPTASWGNMLTNAQSYFSHSAYLVFFPGLAIFITVLAANVFGNAVRDAFDPRLKNL